MKIEQPSQEDLCEYCELVMIGGSSSSSTHFCEGCFCAEALESWEQDFWGSNRSVTFPGIENLTGQPVKCEHCLYNTFEGWTSVDGDPCSDCSSDGNNKVEAI